MTAIIDYGVGNLFSLRCSLESIGCKAVVSRDKGQLQAADRIILPGVGAFGDAALRLENSGMKDMIIELAGKGKPILGICLGMQLLFEESEEFGRHMGLGLIPGRVSSLRKAFEDEKINLKVPHMGWNDINILKKDSLLLKYNNNKEHMYYVHSFFAHASSEYLSAESDYGIAVCGAVEHKTVYGTQFHPEKSGEAGLKLLKAFCEMK